MEKRKMVRSPASMVETVTCALVYYQRLAITKDQINFLANDSDFLSPFGGDKRIPPPEGALRFRICSRACLHMGVRAVRV